MPIGVAPNHKTLYRLYETRMDLSHVVRLPRPSTQSGRLRTNR
jgi:hypothetical protein